MTTELDEMADEAEFQGEFNGIPGRFSKIR
jgi:hypothetical protein